MAFLFWGQRVLDQDEDAPYSSLDRSISSDDLDY